MSYNVITRRLVKSVAGLQRKHIMPITSIGSYITTAQGFIHHWTSAQNQILGTPILLQGGYDLATFETDFATASTSIYGISGKVVELGILRSQLEMQKSAIRERLRQFRGIAQGQLAGTRFVDEVPTLPKEGVIQSRFIDPLDRAATLWLRVQKPVAQGGAGISISLPGAYDVAQFLADITELKATYLAEATGAADLEDALKFRDATLAPFYERMKQYRQVIVGYLPQGNPLLNDVPRLLPKSGTTPKPVTALTATYDVATGQVTLGWTPSVDADVTRQTVEVCLDKKWKSGLEVTKADLAPGVSSTVIEGPAPGLFIAVKVFVHNSHDNVNGGTAVTVGAPVE